MSNEHASPETMSNESKTNILMAGNTHVGKKRTNNEDNYAMFQMEQGVLFLVADGVGGRNYGEVASATIVEVIQTLVSSGKLNPLSNTKMTSMMLTMTVQKAHISVSEKAQSEKQYDGMSSTLTLAYAQATKLWVAQVGDSRLYRFSDGQLSQLTKDQTIAEELVEVGRLSAEQAKTHPDRNTLSQSMGLEAIGRPLETVVTEHDWKKGDVLLACSDGLSDMVPDEEITAILNKEGSLEEQLENLIQAALEGGGKDNITIVLAQNNATPEEVIPSSDIDEEDQEDEQSDEGLNHTSLNTQSSKLSNTVSSLLHTHWLEACIIVLVLLGFIFAFGSNDEHEETELIADAQMSVDKEYEHTLKEQERLIAIQAEALKKAQEEKEALEKQIAEQKQQNEQAIQPNLYTLTITPEPSNATVKMLNITLRYKDGIELEAGDYHIQVSAPGYETTSEWLTLSDQDLNYRVSLNKEAPKSTLLDDLGIKLVTIPAGSFMMGSNEGDSNEKPIHKVSLPSFKMMAHEVTWENYQPCIDAGVCRSSDDKGWGKGKRPVINVSWDDAQTYIKWLNQKTGQTFRLPSEAEWEYAARAGTTSQYSWGNDIGRNNANCDGCGSQWDNAKTAPVGSFNPNAFGLYDMNGNVWEWTEDCWNWSYMNAPARGEAWTSGDCAKRIVRGGSWSGKPGSLRSANRSGVNADNRFFYLGFRLVHSNASP